MFARILMVKPNWRLNCIILICVKREPDNVDMRARGGEREIPVQGVQDGAQTENIYPQQQNTVAWIGLGLDVDRSCSPLVEPVSQ